MRRRTAVAATLSLAAVATVLVALMSGSYALDVGEVWAALVGRSTGFERTVVWEWRLPRALTALAVGACLGLSGALLQGITRNPLASPDLIGITGGAYAAVLVTTVVLGADWAYVGPAALIGGLVTALVVFAFAGMGGPGGSSRLLLVGVAIAAFLTGVSSWIVTSASLESAMAAAAWGAGTLASATWATVTIAVAVLAPCGVACLAYRRRIEAHELGDELATSLGSAPGRLRLELLAVSVVSVSAATALCGPIGLVALVAPPIGRILMRGGDSLLCAAAVGALLLAVADLLAQHLVPGGPPAGLVTTVLGGGYLLALILRSGGTYGMRG